LPSTAYRQNQHDDFERRVFDVAIIGGGISGVSLYHQLCRRGLSVVLLERSDFASGSSQASAMMIWGGLLYLRHAEFRAVRRLCSARERLLADLNQSVMARPFYLLPPGGSAGRLAVQAALYAYWLMGGCRRSRPRRLRTFADQALLDGRCGRTALVYEEACLRDSDARFVLEWMLPHQNGRQLALNYCGVSGGRWQPATRRWRLDLTDAILSRRAQVEARAVVNAAGVWTDHVDELFARSTPWRHILSKGVFIAFPRLPHHESTLMLPTRGGNYMTLMPWGPVSLWGPTETEVDTPEAGFRVRAADVRLLLDELNAHLASPLAARDIVSLRCGVRPLAIGRDQRPPRRALDLSRDYRIYVDPSASWVSVYGGKLTSAATLAADAAGRVARLLGEAQRPASRPSFEASQPRRAPFPNLDEAIPSAEWCAEFELCWNIEDYLRRRTNVSQWVARGGLGRRGEHHEHLVDVAAAFTDGDRAAAAEQVAGYRCKVESTFDRVLSAC